MTGTVDLREFVEGFVAESDDHLRACQASLIALDEAARTGRPAPAAVRQIYRALHTIKGLAAMVGVQPVVDLAHHMETVVRAADRSGGYLASEALDPLVRGLEAIEHAVRAVARGEQVPPPPARLLSELSRIDPASGTTEPGAGLRLVLEPELAEKLTAAECTQIEEGVRTGLRALRVDFTPSTARANEGVTITSVREHLAALGELVRVLPVSVPRTDTAPGGLRFTLLLLTATDDARLVEAAALDTNCDAITALVEPSQAAAAAAPPPLEPEPDATSVGDLVASPGTVRVPVARLDHVMQGLSSLIVTRHKLARVIGRLLAQGLDTRELRMVADEQARQLRDMREAILQLRMVPVSELLERVPLIVRGLRASTGKVVQTELRGGTGAELDKSVAERVFPALVHLVRNAVDHGIESPEQRREAGKPREGQLRIVVGEPSGNRLELSIEDDGRGIDAAAVARRAGRPLPGSDRELLELLVEPGLSTRDEVTTTSGRGMGMDIVHRIVVRELGGELLFANDPGRGARFTLRIPMTVSIIDSLAFECAGQPYVVALASVEEIVEREALQVVAAPDPGRSGRAVQMLQWRGEIVAYAPLTRFVAHEAPSSGGKVLIVCSQNQYFAFGVDRMLGQQEVVVRPLEDPLVRVEGVSGTTDLGDGRPTLVLDLIALSRRMSQAAQPRAQELSA